MRTVEPTGKVQRRQFLQVVGGVGGMALSGAWTLQAVGCGGGNQQPGDDGGAPPDAGGGVGVDLDVALQAVSAQAQLLPGASSDLWTLRGQMVAGGAGALVDVESGALGPTFHVRRGQKVRIRFENKLGEASIIHWHGLAVPAAMDGHPRDAVGEGGQYVYEFEVRNRAGTYWYHAHPHQRTAEQVYRGMAGLFIVHDSDEDALELPRSEFDIPVVIQDRSFDADNQLVYAPSPMDSMTGWLGDRVLVNGTADAVLRVATQPYRLRLLNGSNSRIYRIAWSDGSPLVVIGTDGGLLGQPIQRPYVMLGPGERIELWEDFSDRPQGSDLSLLSLAFDDGATGHLSSGLRQGTPLTILTVRADRPGAGRTAVPTTLIPVPRYQSAEAINAGAPRQIVPTQDHMTWGLNGRSFELNAVASDEHVKLGTAEIWEFDNTQSGATATGGPMGPHGMGGGGMGMAMPHPMHLHGGQFQVVGRQGVTHTGYVDDGWKDTVLIMPGEKAQVMMRYSDYPGLFLYHCHNLEHEDGGMMRNFAVDP